ncbi:DoxX family protein [Albimonas pacifica]|uniref:Putative oxidoreductase n=1 Tax=Albimonas pacifica TaxID=1114924 RepID=A0A1I3FT20_9RHOB|nr:DoxX family protein [Albimonas pacifica]SFI14304.1 putative oxidoreductase [Albimonas pacifica]
MSFLDLKFLDPLRPWIVGATRIVLGLLLLEHGTIKHLGFPEHPMNAVGLFQLSGVAGVLELIFGTLLAIGLYARFSAFILSGLSAFAYFIMYAPKGFYPFVNGGESAVIYCFALLMLAAVGPGALAVDALRKGRG